MFVARHSGRVCIDPLGRVNFNSQIWRYAETYNHVSSKYIFCRERKERDVKHTQITLCDVEHERVTRQYSLQAYPYGCACYMRSIKACMTAQKRWKELFWMWQKCGKRRKQNWEEEWKRRKTTTSQGQLASAVYRTLNTTDVHLHLHRSLSYCTNMFIEH